LSEKCRPEKEEVKESPDLDIVGWCRSTEDLEI